MTSSSSKSRDLFDGHGYPSVRIRHLPHDFRFADDDVTLTLDYALAAEVTSSLEPLVSAAVARGDNIGVDEVESLNETFFLEYSEVFVARWKSSPSSSSSGAIAAFLIIAPSPFARSLDPCLASLYVIRSRDLSDCAYGELVHLGVQLTALVGLGYTDCVVSVAESCRGLSGRLRRDGFVVVATLPHSVNMAGLGLTDSLIFVKNFAERDRRPRPLADTIAMLSSHGLGEKAAVEPLNEQRLSGISFLPRLYTFRCGLRTVLRRIEAGDDRQAFKLFHESALLGEGVSAYDLPTLAYFRHYMLYEGAVAALEDVDSGAMVGWLSVCPSWFARSKTIYGEPTAVIDKRYQGRGLGQEVSVILSAMAKELGYRALISDYYTHNIRSSRLTKSGRLTVGVIPSAAHVEGHGWSDNVITYRDLADDDRYSTFTQLATRNQHLSHSAKL